MSIDTSSLERKSHAPLLRLGDAVEFIRGITFKPEDKVDIDTDGAVVCMRTKNIQEELDESDLIAVPESFVRREEQRLVTGDTLISSANSWNLVGKCCKVSHLNYNATAGGFISIVRAKRDKLYPDYLYRWLSSPKAQHTIRNLGRQTTNISNLPVDQFLELKIPAPELPEQERIASILDTADDIRRKRQQAIELADQFLRSVFLNIFGDPVTNPKNWKYVPFGDLIQDAKIGLVRNASEFGEGYPYPYVRMDSITAAGGFLPELVQTTSANRGEVEEYSLKAGDFLFNTRNSKELVGKCTVFESSQKHVLFNNNIMRVRLEPDISPYFVSHFLNSKGGKRELDKIKSGTTSVFAIYGKNLNKLLLPIPASSAQEQFDAVVLSVSVFINKLGNLAKESELLMNSLSQKAFVGRL